MTLIRPIMVLSITVLRSTERVMSSVTMRPAVLEVTVLMEMEICFCLMPVNLLTMSRLR